MRSLRSSATVLAVLALFAATPARAQIVYNPASISTSADNTYIIDSHNQLEWYKFANIITTRDRSFADVMTSSDFAGWTVASLAQVQGLETRFGWTVDTPNYFNDNFGLTDAMSKWLGYTSSFLTGADYQNTEVFLEAMTSDAYYIGARFDVLAQNVTTSQIYGFDNGDYFNGDFVRGEDRLQVATYADTERDTGTWLVRAAAGPTSSGCGRLAPVACDVTPTPEPASLVLLGTGLLGVGAVVRRKKNWQS